jgi:hypothetical protein
MFKNYLHNLQVFYAVSYPNGVFVIINSLNKYIGSFKIIAF